MKSMFWVALNLIGLVILFFMSNYKDRNRLERTVSQKLFGYLQLSIMLFLIFDTGMFLLDGTTFHGARFLNYVFSMFFYIASPLPGIFYLFYCDNEIFKDKAGLKRRAIFYLLPAIINAIIVLSTPFTHIIFKIDENNLYERGDLFWVSVFLAFFYVFSIYPILAVQSKKKKISVFKKENIYLYFFPLPSLILTIIQMINYGVLLIGFGFVVSAFLIYISSIQSPQDRRSLSVRCHNMNIIQFAVISSVMMAGMFLVLESTTDEISRDYAAYNSIGTARILETYLNKEIGVLETAAHSKVLLEWVADENNIEKKQTAYDELINTLGVLYNNNIYIIAGESGNEYIIDKEIPFEEFRSHAFISEDNPKDKWVFDLMAQDQEYNLNVDVDKQLHRKRVWLNFKLLLNNEPIGIICTGMELSNIAEQAMLLQLGQTKSRTLIIDENGIINMDSDLLGKDDFLLYGVQKKIYEEFDDPILLSAIQAHLDSIDGYFSVSYTETAVISLYTGRHQYATITPIGTTNWSLVTLYDSSSLFGISKLLPLFVIITVMLILFAISTNRITRRLIFIPLKQLIDSLINMRNNNEQNIYGTERNDEIGVLSNAIQDYFVKGYYDELTGIYNRRYLETTLQQIMSTLSRAEYKLSVMMIDIDFFKKYNDAYGHGQGDICLKAIAEALNKSIMRKEDFVARYGGEEFAVVLPHTGEEGSRVLAESMLQAIRDLKIPHKDSDFGIVTISIGITTGINTSELSRKDYLKKADEALYMSKANGRNGYTYLALNE